MLWQLRSFSDSNSFVLFQFVPGCSPFPLWKIQEHKDLTYFPARKTRPTFTLPFVLGLFYPHFDGACGSNPGYFFSPIWLGLWLWFFDSWYLVPRSLPFGANRPLLSPFRLVLWSYYPAIPISDLARPFWSNFIWPLKFSTGALSLFLSLVSGLFIFFGSVAFSIPAASF